MRQPQDTLMMARTSGGKLVHRPLSPHLQVYRWPVSMVLSIGHRVTGVGLSVGALLMTWWLVAASISEAALEPVQRFLGSSFGVALLLGWAAAMLLHLFLGIRHLMWDAGWGFGSLEQQEPVRVGYESRVYRTTGWVVMGITAVATLIVAIAGFMVR